METSGYASLALSSPELAKNTRLGSVLTEYVEKAFTLPTGYCLKFKTEIGRSIVVPEAQKIGQTIFQTEPRHKITEQYRELAQRDREADFGA